MSGASPAAPMESRTRAHNAAPRTFLERCALGFLLLAIFFIVSVAVYRIRALDVMRGISQDLLSLEAREAYRRVSIRSDILAVSFVLALLAGLWLLSDLAGRIFGRVFSAVAVLFCLAASLFLTAGADFMRVYETAFSKSFVGGEHFTGIQSMLMSAAAELSPVSRIVALSSLGIALAMLSIALWIHSPTVMTAARRAMAVLSIASCVALAACSVMGEVRITREGITPIGTRLETQAAELGVNPLSALVFGPERATFMPRDMQHTAEAFYNTDSLEKSGVDRPSINVKKGPYNIILYFFESTSWSYYHLDVGDRPVLAAMRGLASRGLLLRNHYTNYPLSANTLYSVLSSRYSMYGKAMIFHEYYDVDVDTLPEVLSRQGYAVCFVHSGDLLYASRNKFLADRGIDTIILQKDIQKDERYRKNVGWGADERAMIEPAVAWAKEQSRPFFLMLAPVSPHHPYAVPDDFERLLDPEEEGLRESERVWRNYLNSLHYADASLGLFVEAMEREDLMENTVLVVVTDHGEAFHQHRGNYNHPLFIYEENVRVPALFYGPGIVPEGLELDSVTRHIDIMPSILDLLGIEDKGRRDGESIFSPSKEKMAVFHTSWTDEYMGVRDGRWKYIKRMKDAREELYDLEADPGERRDVSMELPGITARYRVVADDAAAYMIDQYRDIARIPDYRLAP